MDASERRAIQRKAKIKRLRRAGRKLEREYFRKGKLKRYAGMESKDFRTNPRGHRPQRMNRIAAPSQAQYRVWAAGFIKQTHLIPAFVASEVAEQRGITDTKDRAKWERYVERRLVLLYHTRADWKKKLRGSKGREYAYMLVNHWMDAALKKGFSTQ